MPEPAEERDDQPETETREPECSELDDEPGDGGLFGLDEVKRPESHINLY